MSFRRFKAVFRKEGLHILRDPQSLWSALAVPVVMLLLFGYALTLDVDQIPTVVYDQDRTPESRALIAQFRGSRFFSISETLDGHPAIRRSIDDRTVVSEVAVPLPRPAAA